MLKLLHTSDWHLGATLHDASRQAEHELFFQWLLTTIEDEQIDVLVVAGDIFDRSQPSNEALAQYYQLLVALSHTALSQVIIVGGNHDSPTQLDAPRAVLAALDVTVVGGWNGAEPDRHLVPLRDRQGSVAAVALAVPYVHEWALGLRTTGLDRTQIRAELSDRFGALYSDLCDRAHKLHPRLPLVATGHLTATGTERGDAPRDIHLVGSIGGLPATIFDPRLAYVALGHIHRPMPVTGSVARYSGSPIPIGPGETAVGRRVVVVELDDASVRTRSLAVPRFRTLVDVVGPLDAVLTQLAELQWTEPLPPFVMVEVQTEGHVPGVGLRLREGLAEAFEDAAMRPSLIHWHATNISARSEEEAAPPALDSLSIEDVFLRLCNQRGEQVDDDLLGALREAIEAAEVSP